MILDNNCDVGNRDLQIVHEFLVDMYKSIEKVHDLSDDERVKWRHAIHTCGEIGYNYYVTSFRDKSCEEYDGIQYIIDELNEDLIVAKRVCDILNRINDEIK